MTEPDVALTDYAIAIECAIFVYLLHRRDRGATRLGTWLLVFFGATSLAALAGGTVHGFFLDAESTGHVVFWRVALVAIGAAALSAWAIGAEMLLPSLAARRVSIAAGLGFAGYCAVVLFFAQNFRVAVIFYLPAGLFLFGVLCVLYARERERHILIAGSGLALTFVAAAVQQAGIALHSTYFNHNALYHLIQAVALWLLFLGFRSVTARSAEPRLHADAA